MGVIVSQVNSVLSWEAERIKVQNKVASAGIHQVAEDYLSLISEESKKKLSDKRLHGPGLPSILDLRGELIDVKV